MSSASDEGDFVVVQTFGDRFGAEVAKTALDAAGIPCFVRADDAGGQQVAMWVGTGVDLVVRAEDATRAEEILNSGDRAS